MWKTRVTTIQFKSMVTNCENSQQIITIFPAKKNLEIKNKIWKFVWVRLFTVRECVLLNDNCIYAIKKNAQFVKIKFRKYVTVELLLL